MRKIKSLVAVFVSIFCVCSLSASSAQEQRDAIVIEARKHIGTPYKSGGKSPDGFDCSGFVYYIARESVKKQLPRSASAMYKACSAIEDNERYAGDLVFFKTTSSGNISHVGLYIGRKQFIHAASDGPNTGVIISSLNESYWKNHYYASGRFLPAIKGSVSESAGGDSGSGAKEKASGGSNKGANGSGGKSEISEQNLASKKKSSNTYSGDIRFLCSVSASVDWRAIKAGKFAPNFRGLTTQADITIGNWLFSPGVGLGIRWNYACAVFQFPIYLTFLISDYVRAYGGLVLTAGNAHMPRASKSSAGSVQDVAIKAPVFPGMFGLSFFTPSLNGNNGRVLIQFRQDFCYTIFKKADGTDLSSQNSYEAGFVLSTGIKLSFPLG
ncbi:MAG: C40 family peptidase [Treponema sp.]|nr:C40 family peptidase [Treponema sp.]